jgi:hypothetical protein
MLLLGFVSSNLLSSIELFNSEIFELKPFLLNRSELKCIHSFSFPDIVFEITIIMISLCRLLTFSMPFSSLPFPFIGVIFLFVFIYPDAMKNPVFEISLHYLIFVKFSAFSLEYYHHYVHSRLLINWMLCLKLSFTDIF